MNVKVGDRVRVNTLPGTTYSRFNGQEAIVKRADEDGVDIQFEDRAGYWFFYNDELELLESVPDPKNTLNSIADVFRSAVVSEADVADIKKLLEEAGYEF